MLSFSKKIIILTCLAVGIFAALIFVLLNAFRFTDPLFLGADIHSLSQICEKISSVNSEAANGSGGSEMSPVDLSERFQRPSKQKPYQNHYSYQAFMKDDPTPPLITKTFDNAKDVILAYYGILRDASNMAGYCGGCGTIGYAKEPYPYAHELLTTEAQAEMPLNRFINSFEGVGYMMLLKLYPAYSPPDTPSDIKHYVVEVEAITGREMKSDKDCCGSGLFAYYYGIVTLQNTPESGWKIEKIDYLPEDFLCAPMHSWFYLSDAVVQIVYGDNLKIIEKIDKTEKKEDMVYIYASGGGMKYRFDFIRLTNGYDVLLFENVEEGGQWKETTMLPEQWRYLKLFTGNFIF